MGIWGPGSILLSFVFGFPKLQGGLTRLNQGSEHNPSVFDPVLFCFRPSDVVKSFGFGLGLDLWPWFSSTFSLGKHPRLDPFRI